MNIRPTGSGPKSGPRVCSGFRSGLWSRVRSHIRLRTRTRRAWLLVCTLAVAAVTGTGCVNLAGDAPQVWYELRDLAPAPATGSSPALRSAATGAAAPAGTDDCVLLIAASAVDSFHASTAIAYRRQPGRLALYQYAQWSEPPAARIGRLLGERLRASGAWVDVASASGLVRGRWLLELELETLVHDDVTPPGFVRLDLALRLIDRSRGRTVALRRFDGQEALLQESAASAVDAFSRALTRVLDDAAAWLPQQTVAVCAPVAAAASDPGSGIRRSVPD